ncbi:hypothetical protein JAAARDRAFT_41563 [Jaapia argillacea MUCL 33604]|uniref:Uncharacterized protein n=1 Tax=Jaapia argillacea MUCL 33604 TaxID=933084 RepID=A0A067P8K4_9AGAM|nr:hypothetical protein JAAARDRAFT_41563 [Jaapia argillacea MUCL 33604]
MADILALVRRPKHAASCHDHLVGKFQNNESKGVVWRSDETIADVLLISPRKKTDDLQDMKEEEEATVVKGEKKRAGEDAMSSCEHKKARKA